ncbi:MAG: hypothetical protein RL380_1429 [Verrucomicrobiota bacterium]|jgi:hypothetical protein
MALPEKTVTLTAAQAAELNRKLSTLRHDVNNQLLLIMASAELIRVKPAATDEMVENLLNQAPKITEAMSQFSRELELTLGLAPAQA